jgi:predicted ATPase
VFAAALAGCVERELTITSQPEGALVYVSDVEVGRTPVTIPFTWYQNYDVILRMDGYQTLKTHARLTPPWYEVPPLDLLQFLLYEGPARLLIIGAYRPEDTPALHPLTQLRRSLSRERRVEIIPLQPLEQTSIESLVANLVQASDRVRLAIYLSPESQGNPFFLTELLYSLREIAAAGSSVWKLPPGWEQNIQPLTRSMQDVVLDRVERLSPVSLDALKAAAVIGDIFEAAMLAAVSGHKTAEFLVDWQQRHLVKSVGSDYEFAHHKIQQVVYESIPLAERQRWHLAVGQYLAEHDGPTNRTAQLAHHYYHSAEPVLALPYFLRAAKEAIEALAFE